MTHTRRQFISTGALGALAVLAGCEDAKEMLASYLAPEAPHEFQPPDAASIDGITHVLQRLTFGPLPEDRARVSAMGVEAFFEEQIDPESIDDRRCDWKIAEIESIHQPRAELYNEHPQMLLRDLSRAKMMRARYSRRQLQEVMVDFWSDHFNVSSSKGDCRWLKVADEREAIRPHVLGRFRDMVRASALSPAMLIYLDGHDNKVMHPGEKPNENYARELLELHTLGVHGGYTQQDVMEAARCLSGWTHSSDRFGLLQSVVKFNPARHDDGEKLVLGQRIAAGGGARDLDRVIQLACDHPSTVRHIATKLCRLFIADPPPETAVDVAAACFTRTDGDIREVLRSIFRSEEFQNQRGNLFKRPQRFVVSALRALEARSDIGEPIFRALERLGQSPYVYPTPDGYPLEMSPWLGTLLWRWNFAVDLAHGRLAGTSVDLAALRSKAGSDEALVAHLWGRRPTEAEHAVLASSGDRLALALASPAFQWH